MITTCPMSLSTNNRYKPGSGRLALAVCLLASVGLTSGCATVNKKGIQDGFRSVSTGIRDGVKNLRVRGPSKESRSANDASKVVSQFPLNQVPHTLMKKPLLEGRLTSGHGYRLSPTGIPIPRKHKGVDYAAPAGTPIYAAGDGVIEKHYVSSSYGNFIRIEHSNDFFTAYAHMQAFADGLVVGSVVTKGQIIGVVGSTGRSSGNHLHFELIHKGKFIDPLFEYTPPSQMIADNDTPETREIPEVSDAPEAETVASGAEQL